MITDISHPNNPIEVGHYDTYPQGSGNGFYGCWGVYPYLPSGNILASDMQNGLFVLGPTYMHGCYLQGTVSDSVTGALLNSALIEIIGTSVSRRTDFVGNYATGIATAVPAAPPRVTTTCADVRFEISNGTWKLSCS